MEARENGDLVFRRPKGKLLTDKILLDAVMLPPSDHLVGKNRENMLGITIEEESGSDSSLVIFPCCIAIYSSPMMMTMALMMMQIIYSIVIASIHDNFS